MDAGRPPSNEGPPARRAARSSGRIWRWAEWSLGLAGLSLLLIAALSAAHRSLAADRALARFDERPAVALADPAALPDGARPAADPALSALAASEPDQSLWSEAAVAHWQSSMEAEVAPPIAALSIPRLALRLAVLADVDPASLHRSIGWIPGTAPPGAPGNVGIAGHRDSHFRKLKDIRIGDRIVLESLHGPREFEVARLEVIPKEDNQVLAPTEDDRLTLVTCYPFYYVGSAPDRWIVSAEPVADRKVAEAADAAR